MFAFIDTQRTRFSVTSLCRRYRVTTGGFYAWLGRSESCHAKQDRRLSTEIMRLFTLHHARYGSPRLHRAMQTLGFVISRRRVAQLMRRAGLRAKAVQGYRAKANIHQLYARHPNRLWTAQITGPSQAWVGDITYFKVGTSWRYLAIVMDQHTRRILAWSLTRRRTASECSARHSLAPCGTTTPFACTQALPISRLLPSNGARRKTTSVNGTGARFQAICCIPAAVQPHLF